MRRPATLLAAALLLLAAAPAAYAFDLQGHRGARGLAPENTMAAFERALEVGVTTLETDMAMTRDGVLVLSHDPYFNPDLTRGPDGKWLDAPGPAIRRLSLDEVRRYDVGRLKPGTRYAAQWPRQVPVDGARIPTLAELMERVRGLKVRLNIETKLTPDRPDEAADPETFARAVAEAVTAAGMTDRVLVQSFDWRTLTAIRRIAPSIATSCLTIETPRWNTVADVDGQPSRWTAGLTLGSAGGSVPRLVAMAGCRVWSPFWRNVDAARMGEARAAGLKVVPWT
ncbi:MAG: glycerophosphodiester phosphodiesterase, partial [Hyphomicrobiales bacterium]|nr:glycerophosphodiester phosphodiesterase [Hyphomicrobiales bacterium]